MSVRVLHWFPNFSAGGGVANAVFGLASAQAEAGADVIVASLPNDRPVYGLFESDGGLKVVHWTGRTVGRGAMRLHVPDRGTSSSLRALRPDVVHLHAEFNPDNWWPPRLWSSPLVLSPHGAFHTTVLERRARQKALYKAVADRFLYRRVAYYHALNPAEEADVASALAGAQTYCAPQGASPAVATFVAARGPRTQSVSRTDHPVRFLFVGRLDVEPKGLDVLIEAFALAVEEDSRPAVLSVVGPNAGNGAARLADLARRLGVANRVEFRPPVAQMEVPALIEECDVYVQLSRNEGSPLSLNDALVMGRPAIVSSRVGTVSDPKITSPGHVLVVEPEPKLAARAIVDALRNLDDLQGRARRAQPIMQSLLSWKTAARQHLELYQAMVEC